MDRARFAALPAAPVVLVVGGPGGEGPGIGNRDQAAEVSAGGLERAFPLGWRMTTVAVEISEAAGGPAGESPAFAPDGPWERTAAWMERGAGRLGVRRGVRRLTAPLRDAGVQSSAAALLRAARVPEAVRRIEAAIAESDAAAVTIADDAGPLVAMAAARAARRRAVGFAPRPDAASMAAALGERVRRRLADRDSVSAAYGAESVLRRYGMRTPLPGFWMHGWTPAWHQVDPLFVAQHKRLVWTLRGRRVCTRLDNRDLEIPQWVATEGQRAYLQSHGYRRVEAIGLPVVYDAAVSDAKGMAGGGAGLRDEGLLLAMPPHNQPGRVAGDPVTDGFLAAVLDSARDFDRVLLCVSADDLAAGRWWPAFAAAGIDVIVGGSSVERDALHRMRSLMSLAGTVVSNGLGSHLAYAAWCGARVCVHGPWADAPSDAIAASHRCLLRPELAAVQHRLLGEAALRTAEPWLFVPPRDARTAVDWGADEVGESMRRTPLELDHLAAAARESGAS